MDTLVRNATLRFSKRVDRYEALNPIYGQDGGVHGSSSRSRRSMFSRPKSYRIHGGGGDGGGVMKSSFSSRRDRARKRSIFLQSYKLGNYSSMEETTNNSRKSKTKKLKKAFVKVKSIVVSVLSYIGTDSLRSCNSRSAISASLPTRVVKCC